MQNRFQKYIHFFFKISTTSMKLEECVTLTSSASTSTVLFMSVVFSLMGRDIIGCSFDYVFLSVDFIRQTCEHLQSISNYFVYFVKKTMLSLSHHSHAVLYVHIKKFLHILSIFSYVYMITERGVHQND